MASDGSTDLYRRIQEISGKLRSTNAPLRPKPGDGGPSLADNPQTIYQYLAQEKQKQLERPPALFSQDETVERGEPVAPDSDEEGLKTTDFGNQIAYLHNEFNFDVARPLQPFALVSHISFVPIYRPTWRPDLLKGMSAGLDENLALAPWVEGILDQLLEDSVNSGDSFRGGRDGVARLSDTILNYDEKYITTRRSIARLYWAIHRSIAEPPQPSLVRSAARRAFRRNRVIHRNVLAQGMSSRLSMMREFALRLSRTWRQGSWLTWVRHHSHYQTLTAVEEAFVPCRPLGKLSTDTHGAAPTLSSLLEDLNRLPLAVGRRSRSEAPLLRRTAFHSFPTGWAGHLFGRYLQGANYLVLPMECLFEPGYFTACGAMPAAHTAGPECLQELWTTLVDLLPTIAGRVWPAEPDFAAFRRAWALCADDSAALRAAARFVFCLIQPLAARAFASVPSLRDVEFCLSGVSQGGAILVSNIKNVSRSDTIPAARERAAGDPPPNAPQTLFMSETLVLDLGMNDFERGRLLKALTEFSTQRILALTAIGNFRFLHDALDTVHERLSRAVTRWMQDVHPAAERSPELPPETDAPAAAGDTASPKATADAGFEVFIASLRQITIELTVLNDLVQGGISAHATSVEGSVRRIDSKLALLGEQKLPGFMSLADFLERRFAKSVHSVGDVGRRYEMIRRRVAELSTLVETQLEMRQNSDQAELLAGNKDLLDKIDRLTLFGIVYYFGSILSYILGPTLIGAIALVNWPHFDKADEFSLEETTDAVKVAVFLILIGVGVYLGRDVIGTLRKEFGSSGREWAKAIGAWIEKHPLAAHAAAGAGRCFAVFENMSK